MVRRLLPICVVFMCFVPVLAMATAQPEEMWNVSQTGQGPSVDPVENEDGNPSFGVEWQDDARFAYVNPAVLVDNLTGLMWCRGAYSSPANWQTAIQTANELETGGYDDWRLPSLRELRSLLHYGRQTTSWLTLCGFVDLAPEESYWSSTTDPMASESVWCVNLDQGTSFPDASSQFKCFVFVR